MKHIKIIILVISFLLLVTLIYADTMNWIIHIKAGLRFKVHFDRTKDKFAGLLKKDPMEFLKGGETYDVVFRNGEYLCTGYHLKKKQKGTWGDKKGNPLNNQISLWGRVYVFDGEGNLYDPDFGLVGRIEK